MKVKSAIKRICGFCQIIRRGKILFVRCQKNNRHKQRQGFHTLDRRFKIGDKTHCQCSTENLIQNFNKLELDFDSELDSDSGIKKECKTHNSNKNGLEFLDDIKNKLI
jgi:large subunit ribosomal protein L36